jgi:GAF domain-containing protein
VDDQAAINFVLSLTDTSRPGFDLSELLCTLLEASVAVLDVDAAGVLLLDEQSRLIPSAATHDSVEYLEKLQVYRREGPCLDSVRAATVVSCDDLVDGGGGRWPEFSRQALVEGYRAVYAVPLRLRDDVVGGLNLFRHATRPMSDVDQKTAQQLATAAAIGILHRRAITKLDTVNKQLEKALQNRIVIEQAKGFLAALHRVAPPAAFNQLRAYSRPRGLPLAEVARAVLDRRLDPFDEPDEG